MSSREKEIAEVIPAVKLPQGLTQFFSYEISEDLQDEIKIGDMVEIPFGRKKIMGIVKHIKEKSGEEKFKLKKIEDIKKEMGFSKRQLEIASFVSEYYHSPLSLIIKTMLPEITKKDARTKIDLSRAEQVADSDEKTEKSLIQKLDSSKKSLFLHSLGQKRHEIYRMLCEKQSDHSQILLMFPEYFDIYSSADFYIEQFGEEKVAILSSDITKNQFFSEWQKVKSGTAKIVIGTRQAVFAPFKNLQFIIVDDEHSSSYKQWDQNPRYHGVETAIELAKIHDAKIILSSPTPTTGSYCRTQKDFELIDISQKPVTAPKIIDMEIERKNGNYSFVSEELKEELLRKIYNKKQALILIPRLGEKTVHQCKDCGHIAECESCQTPLIGYKNKLYCSRCKQIYELMESCPKCQSKNISAFGGGSQRISEEIEEIFENKNIRIVQLDSSTSEDNKKNQKIYADFSKGRIDILVGTQMIWKNWVMSDLELIGIVFPEIIFSSPGFRSREKSRQFLERIYRLAQDKTVIIQSRKPEHKYFSDIMNESAEDFLKKEIKNRQESLSGFQYPPFGKLIKLIYKDPDARACEKEAKWQYEILKKEVFAHNWHDVFEIMPPFPAQSYREYGKYRWHIIIKHKNGIDLQARDNLLTHINKNWIVDIDPDEIL